MENNKLISPDTGAPLIETEKENMYYDKYNKLYYYKNSEGRLIKMTSPMSGSPLNDNEDGTYTADGGKFFLDERGIIPLYIPDDTMEDAHVEGNFLVGNITGRRFPIKEDGQIVMPVDFIDIPKDATSEEIKKYFEDRKKRQLAETQEWIDETIKNDEESDRLVLEEYRDKVNKETAEEIERINNEFLQNNKIDKRLYDYLTSTKERVENGEEISQEDVDRLTYIMFNGTMPNDINIEKSKGNTR